MNVEFYSIGSNDKNLKFVVIQARYRSQWIFVRHKERITWEIPGGHIEQQEDADSAAKRELFEETGALEYHLEPICDYSVELDNERTFGRLYFAEVNQFGNLEYEIEEISLRDRLPDQLTYARIQPYLYERVIEYMKNRREDIR